MYLAYFHSLLVIFVDSIHFIKNLRHIIYFDFLVMVSKLDWKIYLGFAQIIEVVYYFKS
jgi:hypothetical protein